MVLFNSSYDTLSQQPLSSLVYQSGPCSDLCQSHESVLLSTDTMLVFENILAADYLNRKM